MKILLLGATGFLGRRLATKLRSEGLDVVPVAKSLGTDLRDHRQFKAVFEKNPGLNVVVHAAAFIGGIKFGLDHPAEIFYSNTLLSANLFELAREFGIRRVVNPIPNCSYPRDVFPEFREELWWEGPLDDSVLAYGLVRKASYVQSLAYYRQYGLETINLIVPNMYGPGDHFDEVRSHALGALVMKIARAKKLGEPSAVIWGSGKPVREWLYVDDCVEAIRRALSIPHYVEPINIGVGSGVSIAELAELIKREIGFTGEFEFDTSKPDGAPHKVMNIERCKQVFGWAPQTSLQEGVRKTVRWYLENAIDSR
ncbi:MAG: GDP-L-fucose synthetase [Candidatus Rokuibacteriota bacterium]|nr:MAG: GDP-L-fucose synthetase [Candidatus Rokubacteria bacterium]